MVVEIGIVDCKYLSEVSYYNNNFYVLPFDVNGYDIVYEKYSGDEQLEYIVLGHFFDDKYDEFGDHKGFIPKYYLNEFKNDYTFTFDSDKMSDKDEWV